MLAAEFVSTAKRYGKIIISEIAKPYKQKTIKPISVGGLAGTMHLLVVIDLFIMCLFRG